MVTLGESGEKPMKLGQEPAVNFRYSRYWQTDMEPHRTYDGLASLKGWRVQ